MTSAMDKAQQLHGMIARMPQFPTPEQKAEAQRTNRARASLRHDSWPYKVAAFRTLYGLSQHDLDVPGSMLPEPRTALHKRLLNEELVETFEASAEGDLVETVDGILDTIYVALGWLSELGFTPQQVEQLMEEVHASNMTKTDDTGKPVYDAEGKVLKGPNYVKADLALLIGEWAAEAEARRDGQ